MKVKLAHHGFCCNCKIASYQNALCISFPNALHQQSSGLMHLPLPRAVFSQYCRWYQTTLVMSGNIEGP